MNNNNKISPERKLRGRGNGQLHGKKVRLPAYFNERLGDGEEGMLLLHHEDDDIPHLAYYSKKAFAEKIAQALERLSDSEELPVALGTAIEAQVKDGKIAVPKEYLEMAQLKEGSVAVVGSGDRIKIMNQENVQMLDKKHISIYDKTPKTIDSFHINKDDDLCTPFS